MFVTHSSLTDMNAEVKLSSELSVADVKKKRESHVEQGPYGHHPHPVAAALRVAPVAGVGSGAASVGKCVVVAGPPHRPCFRHRLASHVEQGYRRCNRRRAASRLGLPWSASASWQVCCAAAHAGLALCTGSRAVAAP